MADTNRLDYPKGDDGFQFEEGYNSDPEEPLPTYEPLTPDRERECDEYFEDFLARELEFYPNDEEVETPPNREDDDPNPMKKAKTDS